MLSKIIGEGLIREKLREIEAERERVDALIQGAIDKALLNVYGGDDPRSLRQQHSAIVEVLEAQLRQEYLGQIEQTKSFIENLL